MLAPPSIVWLRQNPRTADTPALNAAVEQGGPVIPVYIWVPWVPGLKRLPAAWIHKP